MKKLAIVFVLLGAIPALILLVMYFMANSPIIKNQWINRVKNSNFHMTFINEKDRITARKMSVTKEYDPKYTVSDISQIIAKTTGSITWRYITDKKETEALFEKLISRADVDLQSRNKIRDKIPKTEKKDFWKFVSIIYVARNKLFKRIVFITATASNATGTFFLAFAINKKTKVITLVEILKNNEEISERDFLKKLSQI